MDIDVSTTVPGTVHLIDLPGQHTSGAHASNDIVLVPQPSSDPEDPLNWSRPRKFWSLAMVFVYTLGVGIATTLHYSIMTDITRDTGITTTDLVQGNGVMFLFLGWGCLICQPIALTYGRRGTYVMSALAMVPLMIWTRYATTAGEWFAQRIIIGTVAAPIEALPEISIPDIFFAHERGTWISGYVLTLFGSNFIAPLIAGWFDDAFGWRWTMYFGAIVSAGTFVILFFGMEETMYFRHTVEGVEVVNADGDVGVVAVNGKGGEKAVTPGSESSSSQVPNAAGPMRRSYLSKLKPFGRRPGSPTVPQMLTMMYRPLLIILKFPNIAWAGFIYGINLSWYNVMNGTASPVLSASPYNWSAALVGCIYAGPIVGAIFACTLAGTLTDRLALHLARRNNGIREPEQRLWPLTIAGVLSGAGLITWGVGAYHGIHWSGLAFGLGMMVFGLVVGGSVALAYAVDCFKEISGESMASVIIIRNTIGFGFSYAITPWYTGMGLQNCFILAGFVSLACMSTFLLMLWKGKALRAASASTYWKYVESSIVNVGH